jgi:hypothetical protein
VAPGCLGVAVGGTCAALLLLVTPLWRSSLGMLLGYGLFWIIAIPTVLYARRHGRVALVFHDSLVLCDPWSLGQVTADSFEVRPLAAVTVRPDGRATHLDWPDKTWTIERGRLLSFGRSAP